MPPMSTNILGKQTPPSRRSLCGAYALGMTATPSHPDAVKPLLVTKSCKALTQELEALKRHVEEYASAPQAGCLYLQEEKGWKGAPQHSQHAHRRRLWQQGLSMSRLTIVNVLDHLWAIVQVLSAESITLYSHQTLTRVACEGAARIAYLLDAQASYDARLLRAATPLLADAEGKVTATREVMEARPELPITLDRAVEQRDAVLRMIELAGIRIIRDTKSKAMRLELGDPVQSEPYKPNLTALVAKYFPERPGSYRSTSGIVHSNPWMLGDTVRSSTLAPELELGPHVPGIGAAVMTAIDASIIVMEAYARYYGHDPKSAVRVSRLRQQAIDIFMQQWFAAQFVV
jgi:hypothetical protein